MPRVGPSLAALSVAVLLSLVSCAAPDDSTSTSPSRPPSAATSADPLAAPASQFPGNCSDFLSTAVVSGILGTPAADPTVAGGDSAAYLASNGQSGDLLCDWASDSATLGLGLELRRHAAVLAADAVGWWTVTGKVDGIDADHADGTCNDVVGGGGDCEVHAVVGDYWLGLTLLTPDGMSAQSRRSAMISAAASVVARLRAEPVPALWTPPPGAWSTPIDCAALGAKSDVSGASGVVGLTVSDTTTFGDEFRLSNAVARLGGTSTCRWSAADAVAAEARMYAGAGWALSAAGSDSGHATTAVAVAGADDATIECAQGDATHCAISARVGPNLLVVSGSTLEDHPSTQAELVAVTAAIIVGLRAIRA